MPDSHSSDSVLPILDARTLARRIVPAFAAAAVAAVAVLAVGPRIPGLAGALRRAVSVNPGWVGAAIGLEAVSLAGYVALLAFVAGGAAPRVRWRESAQITLAGAAATRLLPTAGAGGAALALWTLRRAGLGSRAAARTLLAFLVVLYAVFLSAIALAGAVLALGVASSRGPAALSAVPAVLAVLAIALCLGLAYARGPGRSIDARRGPSLPARVRAGAALLGLAVRDACRLVRSGDRRLIGAIAYWGFDAAVLWAMLKAFGASPALPAVALAYLVGQVANTLPLPGSVSGGTAGALVAFGVAPEFALAAALGYRTVAVWLPTPVALAAVPRLRATVARWAREDAGARCCEDGARHRWRGSYSATQSALT